MLEFPLGTPIKVLTISKCLFTTSCSKITIGSLIEGLRTVVESMLPRTVPCPKEIRGIFVDCTTPASGNSSHFIILPIVADHP